jgi:lipopolysaccharide transport system ATP-binding protein
MSDIAIKVENLGKSYLVGHESAEKERYTALRDILARNAKSFARKTKDMLSGKQIIQGDEVEEFWALKDINFEIKQGERVGIIGRNGAGKSTLLKILSRITEPTTGRVSINGRVASLLEVGTGFHPELTGRENIYLNGAILGMSRKEIQRKFDEIVDFAEVEKFLDTPVKRYSSGMYVRLAFAVAAHLEPDVLIVDEVLAVGDVTFQKKCIGKMEDVAKLGRTVLFVSHNMTAIRALCARCLLLDQARLTRDSIAEDVIYSYISAEDTISNVSVDLSDHPRRLKHMRKVLRAISVLDSKGFPVSAIYQGEEFSLSVTYSQDGECRVSHLGFAVYSADGTRVGAYNTAMWKGLDRFRLPAAGTVIFKFASAEFNPGEYFVVPSAASLPNILIDKVDNAISFSIEPNDIYGTGYILTPQDGYVSLRCDVHLEQ